MPSKKPVSSPFSIKDVPKRPREDPKPPRVISIPEEPPLRPVGRPLVRATATRAAPFDYTVRPNVLDDLMDARTVSLAQIHGAIGRLKKDLDAELGAVPVVFAGTIGGQLLFPDGTPAKQLAVAAEAPVYKQNSSAPPIRWPNPTTMTDARGIFALRMPKVPVPKGGLTLTVRGADGSTQVALSYVDLVSARLGVVVLDRRLKPLPAPAPDDVAPVDADDVDEDPGAFTSPAPAIMLGEGDCARSFRAGSGVVDRFRYSMLIRLVDPQVSSKHLVVRPTNQTGNYVPVSVEASFEGTFDKATAPVITDYLDGLGGYRLVDRAPVERPIDVARFHGDVEASPTAVAKASSLALGYVLNFSQVWIPQGLSLGNLVYSLPLAPGEEQLLAVFEQRESFSVRDSETLDVNEAQQYAEQVDTSAHAVYESAFDEISNELATTFTSSKSKGRGTSVATGGSWTMPTPYGVFGLMAAVGASFSSGSTTSSGTSASWQNTSSDFVSSAAEDFQSRLSRQAEARRRSVHTAVRLATGRERESISTKRIANHNRCHALTIQYWEVLRHYAISSNVQDAQLVCYVPLELIPWLPAGQERTLPTGTYTREDLLERYSMVLHYAELLTGLFRFRPDERYGLRLLRQFAADPTAEVEPSTASVSRSVQISIDGTFLPFEDVSVYAFSESGARLGPFRLAPTSGSEPAAAVLADRDALIADLRARRAAQTGTNRSAIFVLPSSIDRTDLVRFDFVRTWRPYTYEHPLPGFGSPSEMLDFYKYNRTTLTPDELESEVGGPEVWDAVVSLEPAGDTYVATPSGRTSAQKMPTTWPLPASRIEPILAFDKLLRIEQMFQHVVRNTVRYSKAVWRSMSPEERAILLERYTMGIPIDGVSDAAEEIPLLNAVANKVLGFFGNAMVMPFHIPAQLTAQLGVTTRDIQDALLQFHRQAFNPPQASITLPTRGMLGEAVLGSCNACEKIDLTRFWNWQDSPVPEIAALPTLSQVGSGMALLHETAAAAPSALTPADGSVLSIATSAPTASSADLVKAMLEKLPAGSSVGDMAQAAQLAEQVAATEAAAVSEREAAMANANELAASAMSQLGSLVSTAQAESDEQEAEAQAAQDQAQADAQAQAEANAEARNNGLATLQSDADSIAELVGKLDPDAQSTMADRIIGELLGDDVSTTMMEVIALSKAYADADDDSDTVKQGKKVMREALGLPE